MKVLLSCLNVNGLGGSELFHYELARELHKVCDLTLFTLRGIDSKDQVRTKLTELGVRQLDLSTFNVSEKFDIILASQPKVNKMMVNCFSHTATPIVSIIHSEIRSEEPVLNTSISHYVAIRESIADMLTTRYGINENNVSLIYNPIDRSRFNSQDLKPLEKTTGLFVGEVLDPIRTEAVKHLVASCIENDWNLLLMSDTRYDFLHPNIKYVNKTWNTENLIKQVHFTGGILLGRTTLESWSCNIPSYIYHIDINGELLDITLDKPEGIEDLCDSEYVAKSYLDLCNKILST